MGFGLLFIGYIATYLLYLAGGYGCFPAIIGCFIMLYALTKLAEYESQFKYAFFAIIPLIVCWGYFVSIEISAVFVSVLPGFLSWAGTQKIIIYVRSVFDLLYHITLLFAIAKISSDTGIEKNKISALRNIVIYSAFFVAEIIEYFISDTSSIALYVFFTVMLLWLIELILNSICIFSCYMRICDEGDQEMEAKPSKFKFINDFRAEYNRREAKAQKENREYRIEKLKNKAQKRQNKRNK